jgi:hypothetical protein
MRKRGGGGVSRASDAEEDAGAAGVGTDEAEAPRAQARRVRHHARVDGTRRRRPHVHRARLAGRAFGEGKGNSLTEGQACGSAVAKFAEVEENVVVTAICA